MRPYGGVECLHVGGGVAGVRGDGRVRFDHRTVLRLDVDPVLGQGALQSKDVISAQVTGNIAWILAVTFTSKKKGRYSTSMARTSMKRTKIISHESQASRKDPSEIRPRILLVKAGFFKAITPSESLFHLEPIRLAAHLSLGPFRRCSTVRR